MASIRRNSTASLKMKLHRFYVGQRWARDIQHFGAERCWVQDSDLLQQWLKVLRYRVGDDLSLFNDEIEVLYKITEIKPGDEVALHKVTDIQPKRSARHVLLAWSILKKDKNDWVLQKATELGVTHFAPIMGERSEKTGFNKERAIKIAIEAAEQCGRIDIPVIDEARDLPSFIRTYQGAYKLYFCDVALGARQSYEDEKVGVIIGPEGGWADSEIEIFKEYKIDSLSLGGLTLRAETAAVVAATKLMGDSI